MIPAVLAVAYESSLKFHGLESLANQPRPKRGVVGGETKADADLHFAQAFSGSVARAQLALLDPHGQVFMTSTTLRKFLSGGELCLVDIPCGSGASSVAFLTTIVELRRAGVLPRTPLRVKVIGGEISETARSYAESVFTYIIGDFADQAVFVEFRPTSWDVLCKISNSALVELIVQEKLKSQVLIAITNFSSFLNIPGKKAEALPQIEEIYRYSSGLTNAAIWIEPQTNITIKNIFPWIAAKALTWLGYAQKTGSEVMDKTEAYFFPPLTPAVLSSVRLSVMSFDLVRRALK
ncbi:hypothetical protein [Glacieibacterium sp.]|uniref:hypothetical protein n=1 Tax=Glacieibacterium sp. TaxID=2860237 RepID=UPI003B00B292